MGRFDRFGPWFFTWKTPPIHTMLLNSFLYLQQLTPSCQAWYINTMKSRYCQPVGTLGFNNSSISRVKNHHFLMVVRVVLGWRVSCISSRTNSSEVQLWLCIWSCLSFLGPTRQTVLLIVKWPCHWPTEAKRHRRFECFPTLAEIPKLTDLKWSR